MPQDSQKGEVRFTSKKSAKEIVSTIEEAARPLGFNVHVQNHNIKLRGGKQGRKGQLSVSTQVGSVFSGFLSGSKHRIPVCANIVCHMPVLFNEFLCSRSLT